MPKVKGKKQQEMLSKEIVKKEDPYKNVNHKKTILNKHDVKKRNEQNKDYSKQMNRVAGMGRHRVYLGNNASDRKGTILRLWKYLDNYRPGLIVIVLAMIVTSVLSVMLPLLFATAIDDYILVYDFEGAYVIGGIIIGVAILTSAVRFTGRYVMTIITQKTVAKIRKDAFDKLQMLPVSYYDKNQSGDIVSRITNDVDLISNMLAQFVLELITSAITLVGSFIMMFIVNWSLALIVVVFVPIMVIFTGRIGKITRKGFTAQQKFLGNLNGIVEESVSGIKNIKLYGSEKDVINEFSETNTDLRDAGFKAQVAAGLIMPVINFLNNLIYVVIVFIGGLLYIGGKVAISIGDISAVTSYARQFIQPISNLAQLFNTLQQGLAGAERVFNLIDTSTEYETENELIENTVKSLENSKIELDEMMKNEIENASEIKEYNVKIAELEQRLEILNIPSKVERLKESVESLELSFKNGNISSKDIDKVKKEIDIKRSELSDLIEKSKFKGFVEFKDVTFGYEEDKVVLKDISFKADIGKTVAIVGPTGSGKTTIINLLNRFYDVDSGTILIDNKDINEYKKDNLRKNIGVVLQDTKLFTGTVFDNIVYGNLEASKVEVEKAATLANAHDFIMRLPHGYDSEVYEEGSNFSQGERQLISIARTILSNPDILILDEATSNVDTRTEFKIQESMNTLMKGRTSFVIAHRLQTIRNANKIIVIKEGELIESGNHNELLHQKGFYYDLYTTQFKNLVLEEE